VNWDNWKGAVVAKSEHCLDMPGGTEENQETLQSGQPISRPRFESRASRILVQSPANSIAVHVVSEGSPRHRIVRPQVTAAINMLNEQRETSWSRAVQSRPLSAGCTLGIFVLSSHYK
jgi:hypothetical protein